MKYTFSLMILVFASLSFSAEPISPAQANQAVTAGKALLFDV